MENARRTPFSRDDILADGLGARVVALRERMELNKSEFARRLGVSPSQVGFWERDIRIVPRERRLQICREFGVERDWLELGTGRVFQKRDGDPKTPEELKDFERIETAELFVRETTPEFRRALYDVLVKEFGA